MKKLSIFLCGLLLGTAAYAGPVSPGKALDVAAKVLGQTNTKGADDRLSIIWDGEFEQTKGLAEDPAFYVVGRESGGFVMVAGNDNVQPVLGFSLENSFKVEGMPANVRWWMEQYKAYCRSAKIPAPGVRDKWAAFEPATKATADPVTDGLENEFMDSRTVQWNQTNPANYYCPHVEGQTYTAVVGCVPLATMEVMAWYGTANIASATGTVPEYTYNSENGKSVTVPAHELGTVYDWASLHDLTTPAQFYGQVTSWSSYDDIYGGPEFGTELTPLGYNLAQLAYDVGTLLQASYNDGWDYSGTGAYFINIVNKVAPVFGYSNSARLIDRDSYYYGPIVYYTNGQWAQMMKEEITKHPVIYTGQSTSGGGHGYVADGYATYNGDLMFHFNMGWGGSQNGYYTLDIQDEFDYCHSALFDFYPNPTACAPLPRMQYDLDGGISYNGGYNTGALSLTLYSFYNYGPVSFSGDIAVGVEDYTGNLKEAFQAQYVDPEHPFGMYNGWNWMNKNLQATSPVLGDRAVGYYKITGEDTYRPIVCVPLMDRLPSVPFFPAAFIKTKASYSVGDVFVFELINNSFKYDDAKWYVTAPGGGEPVEYDQEDYCAPLATAGEYKIVAVIPGEESVTAYITVE